MLRGKSQRIQYWRLCQYEIKSFWLIALFFCLGNQGEAQITPQQRFHQAEIDFQAFKWTEALKGFQEVFDDTALLPNAAAAYRISVCHEKIGTLLTALQFAEKSCQIDSTQDDYWLHYARLLEMKYDYQKAWNIRLKLIQRQPRYISRYEDALQNAWNRNDVKQSLYITQIWKEQFGHNLNLTQKTALLFLALNDTTSAKREYEVLIDKYEGRPDIIEAYNTFLEEISPKTKNTSPCPQAYTELNKGNSEYAYTIIKSCAQENPENLVLLEQQFLIAYINTDLPEMELCIENLEIYFPFLEDYTNYAREVVSYIMKIQTQELGPQEIIRFSKLQAPNEQWKFIQADILTFTGQTELAQKQIESIIKSNTNQNEIPHHHIKLLLYQNTTK
jgi:tetratricopeptide (TPR) repeat protein